MTFADLMGLLVAFFVMLVAFSTQDQKKLQIVAGSMREAFGMQTAIRYSGIIEIDGLPTRPKLKNVANDQAGGSLGDADPGREGAATAISARASTDDRRFALASASLRQALQDMPEIAEMSKHIMIEETKQGLNIEIVDQDGSSMFPEGSKEPYERTRRLIQKLAATLKAMPYRISISGHTAASKHAAASPAMGPGSCRPTAPMRSARSSRRRACRRQLLHGRGPGRHPAAVP